MDNKITKRRLSDFFSYEWIAILAVIIAVIIVWEVVYTMLGVKLTYGQKFCITYDEYVDTSFNEDIVQVAYGKKAFSYDVLAINKEGMSAGIDNELFTRYQTHEADVVIASAKERKSSDGSSFRRANSIIENMEVWSYEKAVTDGDAYLSAFIKDEVTRIQGYDIERAYTVGELDDAKIDASFISRMKKDNRFRSDSEKEKGKLLERQRIYKICEEVAFAKTLLSGYDELFYTYVRFEQSYEQSVTIRDNELISKYERDLATVKANNLRLYGKERLSYGIRTDKLEGSSFYSPADFFTAYGSKKEVVLMAFDYMKDQPHLQFESLSFMNTMVRTCSWLGELS